ncbi:unnamed protein product [Owenia fusiformis]|uniref:Sulfotransferase domain-containing protein n=1 Tax=Owenia fusiformis TaxID=6347 RepID=A0A8S4PMB7_OWEFU|nr:unnamed protein product [Owenia fusiformis]
MTDTKKTFTDVINVRKHEMINGCFFSAFYDWPTLKKLNKLPIREDDILIASYTRSAWRGETNILEDEADGSCYDEVEKMESPRLLVTHQQTSFMPDGVLQGKCKTVLVLRNPKSIIVSNAFMFNAFGTSFTEPITVDMMMNSQMRDDGEKMQCGTWFQQVESWLKVKDQLKDKLLIIFYENMIKDLISVVKSVAKFLGKEFTDDELAKIVHHLQFKEMKENPATGDVFKTAVKTCDIKDSSNSPHMRKGTIDDWKNHMTVAQSEAVDAYFKDKLESLGLKFQYE